MKRRDGLALVGCSASLRTETNQLQGEAIQLLHLLPGTGLHDIHVHSEH